MIVYCRPYFNYDNPLVERFLVYRFYWDEDSLRLTVVDDGVERDLYETPFAIDEESDEFNEPFYLIANLAIGGAFTDAYNLGDPGSGLPVSMPFPAEMYVDYIRVYEWNDQGEVHLGPPTSRAAPSGSTPTTRPPTAGWRPRSPPQIYVWEGTLVDGTIPPYEGDNVLSWQTAGAGLVRRRHHVHSAAEPVRLRRGAPQVPDQDSRAHHLQDRDHRCLEQPVLRCLSRVTRPPTGWCATASGARPSIPVADIRGTAMDLRMLSYAFVILEENGAACEFALDDIYWDAGTTSGVGDGDVVSSQRVELQSNVPNPFNARTEIRFNLAAGGSYEIEIFDAAGHRVKVFQGIGGTGANSVFWDGRDDSGANVGSGMYYYRLQTDDGSASQKMMLVK